MTGRIILGLALVLASVAIPRNAKAGGFDYDVPGTRALGRGGAFIARSDDPMALYFNPAALAFSAGYELMLGSHLAFYDACVDRAGGYDDTNVSGTSTFTSEFGPPDPSDPGNWAARDFTRVCRSGFPGPSPQLVFTGRPFPELGFGVGLLSPAAVGNGVWGNSDGSVLVDGTRLPSPLRYALVEQNLLLFHPTIGVGFSPASWISIGASFQWGISTLRYVTHASSGTGTEDPAEDARAVLDVSDLFVPSVILSAHFVPIDELDIVATARFSDAIDASGTLSLTTGTFGTTNESSFAPRDAVIQDAGLRAGQPWQFGLAFRYSDRRDRRYRDPMQAARINRRVEDPMQNEIFDLELDLLYTYNGNVDDFVLTTPPGATATVCERPVNGGNCTSTIPAPLPSGPGGSRGSVTLPHGWRDQFAVRAGGDWNVLPGTLALRAGGSFETSGLNSRYMIQDFLPGMRIGLSLGVTWRIGRLDLSASYAHVFQFDKTTGNADYRMVSTLGSQGQCEGDEGRYYDPDRPVSDRGCYPQGSGSAVNAGTYSAEHNVLSVQASYHFE